MNYKFTNFAFARVEIVVEDFRSEIKYTSVSRQVKGFFRSMGMSSSFNILKMPKNSTNSFPSVSDKQAFLT